MAAAGYPESPRKGDVITRTAAAPRDDYSRVPCRHRAAGKAVVTAGGRVLCVTALGDTVRVGADARLRIAEQIRFDGMQMRRDIGHRAIRRDGAAVIPGADDTFDLDGRARLFLTGLQDRIVAGLEAARRQALPPR
jgi:hypothetical protein